MTPPPGVAVSTPAFRRKLVAGVLLLNLFVAAMVATALHASLDQYRERAEVTTQNLAQVLDKYLSGIIDKIDIALLSVVDEVARQQAAGGIDGPALNALLARHQGRLPELTSLRVADPEGIVRYGLGVAPGSRVNVGDRQYFIGSRDQRQPALVIDRPMFARISQKWVIVFARRLARPDGGFAGVVYVNIGLDQFAKTFAAIDVGRHGVVALRDDALGLIARYPEPEGIGAQIGNKAVSPELRTMVAKGLHAGSYTAVSGLDRVERTFSFSRVDEKPFYVVVGAATDDYLAEWRQEAALMVALAALFALISGAASWLTLRAWRRQVAAAENLAREEEKFHTVADNTYDWEYWQGADQTVLFMSPSCERITGYGPAEFVADPELLARIVLPEDRHLLAAHTSGAFHDEEAVVDFRIRRRDGQVRWIAHGCRAVVGRDGRFAGRRVSNRDITERRLAELEVRRLKDELERRVIERTAQLTAANKELEEFSYSVSHDLSTPLRAIEGFSHILVDDYGDRLDEEGRRLLGVVRQSAVRMARLIDDILKFLHLGRRPMQPGPIDMARLAQEAAAEAQAAAAGRTLRLAIGELPTAWGDRAMIRQVLANLLSNAVKFTEPRAEAAIEVGGVAEETENAYYVKDNGVGFDMRYVDKLFRPFERVHPTGQFEGTGTGLAMVKRIVGRHGGRVWAEGLVDGGATIHFTLPRREAE